MKIHTNDVQIIEHNGKAAFAVLPYSSYLELVENAAEEQTYIPEEVAHMVLLQEISLLKAWRKHLGISQQQLADKLGVTQGTISQIEKPNSKPQKRTLQKLADAMGVTIEQLTE